MSASTAYAPSPPPGVLVISRDSLALVACLGLGLLYANAMFFRLSSINAVCYLTILAGAGAYFLSDSRRSPWGYLLLPVMLVFNENLAFGYLILLFLQKDGLSPRPLREDKDLLVLLVLGALIIAYRLATKGVVFYGGLGFIGRMEVGFIHPNLAPLFCLMLAYYARHYWSRTAAILATLLFAAAVVVTGSLGKIPLLLAFVCSGWLFRYRRIVYHLTVWGVILVSIPLLLSVNPEVTRIVSGRNLIFQQLIDVMGWKSLVLTVSQSEMVNAPILRQFFRNDYWQAMPFDSVVSNAVAIGVLPSLLLAALAGLFSTPDNRKDFDRRMAFWIFGFSSNPLTIWTPIFLFALKRSPAEAPPAR